MKTEVRIAKTEIDETNEKTTLSSKEPPRKRAADFSPRGFAMATTVMMGETPNQWIKHYEQ